MKQFSKLIHVYEALLAPGGCPWDQKQTMATIRGDLLEECHELIEAISLGDNDAICEELGDIASCLVLLGKLAEKEGRCTLEQAVEGATEKAVRRHPHVFGDAKIETDDELWAQWDRIKQTEKGKETRKSVFDGIPAGLPALARTQRIQKTMQKVSLPSQPPITHDHELAVGQELWELVDKAAELGVDAEQALLRLTALKEKHARKNVQRSAGELDALGAQTS